MIRSDVFTCFNKSQHVITKKGEKKKKKKTIKLLIFAILDFFWQVTDFSEHVGAREYSCLEFSLEF